MSKIDQKERIVKSYNSTPTTKQKAIQKISPITGWSQEAIDETTHKAWAHYNRDIAYAYDHTNAELVLLKGRYLDKKAIKVDARYDNLIYRERLNKYYGITIKKRIFDSGFDSFHDKLLFHTYLFTYNEIELVN